MNDIKSNDIKSLALTRRDLLCGAAASAAALPLALHAASKDEISLQSWSLNRSYFDGYWKNLDLPRLMREKLGLSVGDSAWIRPAIRSSAPGKAVHAGWPYI